jgi:hypothetical protein
MSETEKTGRKSGKRIIDVAHPGTSAPSVTSRPVIVTGRPLLRDPMMAPKNSGETESGNQDMTAPADASGDTLSTSDKQVIKPLEQALGDEPAEVLESDEKNKMPDEVAPVTSDEPGPEAALAADKSAAPDTTDSVPAATEDAQTAPDTPESSPAQQAEAEAVAKTKHDADIQQLIDSKRYVLPINTIENRKSKRFVVLGATLALVLIIIWLDIALDAGIIKLGGLKPLTHFFSN